MAIIGALPSILTNGTTADATQVMGDFNFIVSQVNANAATAGANSNITSILGLTSPLALGQGGTGASTAGATLLQTIGAPAFLRGQLAGMQITAVGSSSVTISAGVCCDSSGLSLITLAAFSKLTSGVWTAGSGANGLGTGVTLASSQTLHMFAIAVGGSFDAYFDTSATAANAPSSTTGYRRILSMRTASTTTAFINTNQWDDTFLYTGSPIVDASGVAVAALTASSATLTVPTGITVTALVDATASAAVGVTPALGWISSLLQADTAVGPPANLAFDTGGAAAAGRLPTLTNTSGQIRWRFNATSITLSLVTSGYIDGRGRTGLA